MTSFHISTGQPTDAPETLTHGQNSKAVIKSPCIRVCAVDGRHGLCMGCGRSLKEIASWSRISADEREAIMQALPARMTLFQPTT